MKYLLVMLIASFSLYAANIEQTIAKVELEKNAKCEYDSSNASFCLNNYCRQNLFYQCISNTDKFKLKLGIRYYNLGGRISNETVRTITYIY